MDRHGLCKRLNRWSLWVRCDVCRRLSLGLSDQTNVLISRPSFYLRACTTTIPASPAPKPTQNAGLAMRNSTTKINTITATILA